MAEEIETQGPATTGPKGGADPVTLALGGGSRDKADALLEEQTMYLRDQRAGLQEEQRFQLSHLRLRRFSDYAKGAMEITIALVVLILFLGLGVLLVQAYRARGLVAEPIKTPPDFASRGLDGTVLSQQLLDKLNRIAVRANHNDLRNPDSIVGSWANQTNVQIPTTGISLTEFTRLLDNWLGRQTHISGELVRTVGGIALTVRVENNPGETFAGPDTDLDKLLERAATSLFRQTQPFDYSNSLAGLKVDPETIAIARQLAEFGPREQRVYGYLAWANTLASLGDLRSAVPLYDQAVRLAPDDPYPHYMRWPNDAALGHKEILLADGVATVRLLRVNSSLVRPDAAAEAVPQTESEVAAFRGAFLEGAKLAEVAGNYDLYDYNKAAPLQIADYYARAHDIGKARAILAANPQLKEVDCIKLFSPIADTVFPFVVLRAANDEWVEAAQILNTVDGQSQQYGKLTVELRHTFLWPWLAYAWARAGNVKGGEDLIAMTPHDCTLCLEMRGRIAAIAGNYPAASYWFDRAVQDAPSVPFAATAWGEMLLRKGDYDAAIAKFTLANQKGPHFADPLEMWGEALMLKNRSDLALTKFEDANKYAPNWGRLHVKWGEALSYVGRKDEALTQYRIASKLDLSVADKAELARDTRL